MAFLRTPVRVTMMFSGFRSRCTIPRVRAAQRIEHLAHQVDGLAQAQLALVDQHLLERRARHVLEGGVDRAVLALAAVDQADDVGVEQLDAQAHLAAQAVHPVVARRPRARAAEGDDLDGDVLPGRELARPVDPPECARPELAQDLVAALEYRAGLQSVIDRCRHPPRAPHGPGRILVKRQRPRKGNQRRRRVGGRKVEAAGAIEYATLAASEADSLVIGIDDARAF
jgi:hypothetical protein